MLSSNGEDKQIYELTVIKGEEEEEETPPTEPEEEKPEEPKKKLNFWLIGAIAAGILLITSGVAFLLFRKKKDKKKPQKNKEESQLPLKKRAGDEPTYEIDRIENLESEKFEDESVTDILKGELFDDDRTQKFDADTFKAATKREYDEDDEDDKTKEFDFKDFE